MSTSLTFARIDGEAYGTPLDSLFDIRVAVEEDPTVPRQQLRLESYPNPFLQRTRLTFTLPRPDHVSLEMVDLLGRVVGRPVQEAFFQAGSHEMEWRSDGLAAGVYMVRLITRESGIITTDIVLVN